MYRIEVDWAPTYELLASLQAYVRRADYKTLDLGAGWAKAVRQRIHPGLAAELAAIRRDAKLWIPALLVRLCPGERDAAGFTRWLGALSAGDLYECLAPYLPDEQASLPRELSGAAGRYAHLLTAWNEQYFRDIDPAILSGLEANAASMRALAATMSPQEMVERATSGIVYAPAQEPDVVLLVPQYHYRPWNLYDKFRGIRIFLYPADVLAPAPGDPPPGLLRLTGALSDGSRLRILRFLAAGPRTFTEVVAFSGLAKSTVHHHMVALRASGLVRVHDADADTVSYSLRPSAVGELGERLSAFLTGG